MNFFEKLECVDYSTASNDTDPLHPPVIDVDVASSTQDVVGRVLAETQTDLERGQCAIPRW